MLMKRSTKLMCLLIAFVWTTVIIGSSYAYFIDSVSVTGNIIAAGNLKAGLEYKGTDGEWHDADQVAIFDYPYWEPNYTDVQYIRVSNQGNLAFQYRLNVVPAGILTGRANLMDVIDVYYGEVKNGLVITKDNYKSLNKLGTLSTLMNEQDAMSGILLPASTEAKVSLPASAKNVATESVEAYIVLHMQEDAGNEYQGLSAGNGFNLQLSATQYMYEEDSFDNSYDEKAEYPKLIAPTVLSVNVQPDTNGRVPHDVAFNNPEVGVSAIVPAGAKMAPGATNLTLVVEEKKNSEADVTLSKKDKLTAFNVKVEGLAADNTVPVIINMGKAMSEGMNLGNYDLYHVENGVTTQMTLVGSAAELDAHNEFFYNPATGEVIVAMATFSEVAVVSDTENAWNGEFDYSWYTGAVALTDSESTTEYIIANADQLAAFSAIVGGMNEQTQDSFAGKTVKLLADVNLGDKENANESLIFHPIGYYYTDDKNADGTTGDYYSTVNSFEGTFDGNGHTISNFYQNTWEIKGDYEGNYYSDAMGLFGYVVNGKVCNLTVDNFSSDGEFTPTGVIAAYAVNSTFENIAITNCNPRVYNTGNGGIVGIGGNSDDPDTYKLTFTNITIDNSNIISALWGSWDVACGGLVGMFRGNSTVKFTNCHVAAQNDAYNDVCGNYQYYWYRYSGMMIGSIRGKNKVVDGYTVPDTTGITAENCTVHFGKWNDYYYCELVANTLASYTHDHQFSRLEQINSLDEIKSGDTWTKAGNFLLIAADGTKTCYHIVNKYGTLTQHLHTDAGEETVNGGTVLKEDKQIVYLPFNQLFQGDGWGVKHIPVYNGEDYAFKGITILDREVADSVVKFDVQSELPEQLMDGTTITIGALFKAAAIEDEKLSIKGDKVMVFVSHVGEDSTAGGTYTANTTDWTQGTLTFFGTGAATITITDYYFCKETTINVTITEKVAVEKFETKIERDYDFLYRVGNMDTFPVGVLFKAADDAAEIDTANVEVTVTSENEGITGTFTANTTDWTKGTLKISGAGLVTISITDNDYCKPTSVTVEVVAAKNAYTGTVPDAISTNVVLLEDVSDNGFTVSGSGRYFYGNGFTVTCAGNGAYGNTSSGGKSLYVGYVTVAEGGTLDNVKVVCNTFPESYMFTSELKAVDGTYPYSRPAVTVSEDSTISGCYVYGARVNILVRGGNVTIKNTITDSGALANIHIISQSDYTVTLDDVTTIQKLKTADFDSTKKVLGFAIAVGTTDSTSNPTIKLTGDLRQYNWVTQDDANSVTGTYSSGIISGALAKTTYQHTIDGKTAVNLGIAYVMKDFAINIEDERSNKSDITYELNEVTMKIMGNNLTGKVYSIVNSDTAAARNDAEADKVVEDNKFINTTYVPQYTIKSDLGGQKIEEYDGCDEYCYMDGDTLKVMFPSGDTKELDLASMVSITKYTGQTLTKKITCVDEDGDRINVTDGNVTLSAAGEYTVTYKVTDTIVYDQNGNDIGSQECSWTLPLSVSLKDVSVPDAYFEFDSTKQVIYAEGKWSLSGTTYIQYMPFLAGLKIYDYNGQTPYLRFDGDNDFAKIAKATINNVNTTGEAAGYHIITVELTDGGKLVIDLDVRATSGGSTHTGSIKVSNNVLYVVNGGTTSAKGQQWKVYDYEFTGNNGVVINSGTVTFGKSGTDATTGTAPTTNFGDEENSGSGTSPCVTPDTLVTLADGSKKEIQHVTYEDQLLVWDFYKGEYAAVPSAIIFNHGVGENTVIAMTFDDGTVVKVTNMHLFVDADTNNFVMVDADNASSHIGHSFVKRDGNAYKTVKLVDVDISQETIGAYGIISAGHYNILVEDMFSADYEPQDVKLFTYFDIGDNMKYDEQQMQADIDQYGLYTYEEFSDYLTYEQFEAFNVKYMKVAVGKGEYTYEGILQLIEEYLK